MAGAANGVGAMLGGGSGPAVGDGVGMWGGSVAGAIFFGLPLPLTLPSGGGNGFWALLGVGTDTAAWGLAEDNSAYFACNVPDVIIPGGQNDANCMCGCVSTIICAQQ